MAFIEGIRIGGGLLQGEVIGNVGTFPHMERAGAALHDAIDANGWESGYKVAYFNDNLSLQIDISNLLYDITYAGGERLLAAIPIYNSVGSLTGNLRMGVSKPYENDYYTMRFRCYVTDGQGTVLGTDWGYSELTFPTGGAWQNFIRSMYLAYCVWSDGVKKYCGLYANASSSTTEPYNNEYGWWYRAAGGEICFDDLYTTFGIEGVNNGIPVEMDPNFGPASEEGGYGPTPPGSGTGGSGGPGPTFDGTSDPWEDTPVKPGVLSFGLLNIYKCDSGALINLGRSLFPEITWPASTSFSDLMEWLGSVIEAFSDSIWNKGLIDYIVSIHLIPVDVSAGNLEDIKIGPRTMTGILGRPVTDDVIEVDCGTIHIDEFYTNYIDFQTRCRMYIPFFGMITLKPEFWQSADLQLKYLWNIMDGSFVAQVFSTINRHQKPCKTMIGQYSGNACVHMPLSGANYANMFAQLAGSAAGIAGGAASGNVAVAATSAMNLAGATSGDMQSSNPYNASSAFYGHARPYVIIERPVSHFSERYTLEKGMPLIKSMTIGSCTGFTQAEDIILDGIPCTDAEKEKIRALFKSGVIIK